MTPWLVSTAVIFFVMGLIALCRKTRPLAKELKWFYNLKLPHKFIVVAALCFVTLWGGSKERLFLPPGLTGGISPSAPEALGTLQPRTLPEELSTNALAITGFEINQSNLSACFTVHWATNLFEYTLSRNIHLFSSTNLLERRWMPLASFAMPPGTNSCAFSVTTNDVESATRPWYLDTFNGLGFYRFGIDIDSDGDCLVDSLETLYLFTDPGNPDSDDDGLPDGWECWHGLNPLSEEGDEGACGDPDHDGIPNTEELVFGTHPLLTDSDNDGLADCDEIGFVEELRGSDFLWLDTSSCSNLLSASTYTYDSFRQKTALPCHVSINGVCHTNAQVDVDGLVTLLNPTRQSAPAGYSYRHYGGMSNYLWSATHVTIAMYNEDLCARPRSNDWASALLVGAVEAGGRTYSVIEYRDFSHWDTRNIVGARMSFQVILPEDETNVVYVSYQPIPEYISGLQRAPVFGVQLPMTNCIPNRGEYCNVSWGKYDGCFSTPLTLKYHLGTGTLPSLADVDGDGLVDPEEVFQFHSDPFRVDSDDDGLDDGREACFGTDPNNPDTDGDGIPDAWEVDNGTNPIGNDALHDPDWDGLANIWEYKNGTDPLNEDTDGDRLGDLREVASFDAGITNVPWFSFQPIKTVVPDEEIDYGLFDCAMPFTNFLGGSRIELALADVNGAVYFGTASATNEITSRDGNIDLEVSFGKLCPVIAGYWSDLKTRPSLGSSIAFGLATTNDEQFFVVQYSRVGTYYGDDTNEVSFQISIPKSMPDTAFIRYGDVLDDRTSGHFTIGIQGAQEEGFQNSPRLNYYYGSTPPMLTNGFALAFNFGTGGDPLVADTDGDGLDDRIEAEIGTNPRSADTDGDGFTDADEIGYGMNPCSAFGRDGADGDLDGDGLANALEASYGTSLMFPDCDGDGVPDGTEISMGTNPLKSDTDGDGLSDGEEVANQTNPLNADTDDDGLPDGWEIENGTDPLSATGDEGRIGDVDGDGLPNCLEYNYETDSTAVDSDGDGLPDGLEVVDIYENDALPWFSISSPTDLTPFFSNDWECVGFQLPAPIVVQGETVTNVTIDLHGLVYLDKAGYVNTRSATTSTNLKNEIDPECLVLAPYLGNWSFTNIVGQSGIRVGMAADWTNGYVVIEYSNMYYRPQSGDTNVISFQVSIPTGVVDRVNVKYADAYGDGMDGRRAIIGFQSFGFRNYFQYCRKNYGKVHGGLGLVFLLGYGTNPSEADTDGDGLSDGAEVNVHGSDPLLRDTDADGLDDALELSLGTSPTDSDSDGDGLPDGWELDNGLDPVSFNGDDGAAGDPDGDGLSNIQEYALGGDPQDTDTDDDGLSDGQEVVIGTDVTTPDTDGDGLSDSAEATRGTNPLAYDSDNDGLSDGWEVRHGFNPLVADNANLDTDSDGLTDLQEQLHGTNPRETDTDGDLLPDYSELNESHTDPTKTDTDGDGLLDKAELDDGLDPLRVDSDRDGMPDGWETLYELNALSASGADGANGDLDGDGVLNIDEYRNNCNPRARDTDGDGVNDNAEITNCSNPADASDGGNPPDPELLRESVFNINGDWAAWEMTIEGLGPYDTRTMRITMGAPNSPASTLEKLRKDNSYRLSMKWLNCDGHDDDSRAPWYCWKATIDDRPSVTTFGDYSSSRKHGIADLVVGNCWLAENDDGLLTSHIHEDTPDCGNVAEGRTATLYVLDFKHDSLWETSNKSNRIFNDTPKDDFSEETVCETDENGNIWSAHRNELYVVADKTDNTFNVTEKLKPLSIPQQYVGKVLCGAFDGEEPKGQAHLSDQLEAVMRIEAPKGAAIVHYDIRVGVDSNNNGKLDYDESVPLKVYEYNGQPRYAAICGTTTKQSNLFDLFIGGVSSGSLSGATDMALPVGRAFLSIFYNGNANHVNEVWAPSSIQSMRINAFAEFSDFSEWLTHNSGANFTDEGIATISNYVWEPETEMSRFMAQRKPLTPWQKYTTAIPIYNEYGFITMYRTYYLETATGKALTQFFKDKVLPVAISRLTDKGNGATEILSSSNCSWTDQDIEKFVFNSMSTISVTGITQVIGAKGNYGGILAVLEASAGSTIVGGSQIDDLDAFFAVGRGRLLDPKYSFAVRKTTHLLREPTYELISIGFSCKIQDLYDFNFEDGLLSKSAAALQIGYGNGCNSRSHGQIYRHEIRINTTYQNPFVK